MQLRNSVFVLATLLTTALSYQVTSPSDKKGWTSSGPQTLTWSTVSTDASTFAAVLDNQINPGVLANGPVVLKSNIDGSSGSVSLDPPSGGWEAGSGYRINLVKDEKSLDTIYAQSEQFNITPGASGSSSSSVTPSGSSTSGTSPTSSKAGNSATPSGSGSPSDSASNPDESGSSGLPGSAVSLSTTKYAVAIPAIAMFASLVL